MHIPDLSVIIVIFSQNLFSLGFKNSNVSAQARPSNEAGNKNKQDQDFIAKVLEGFELSNKEEELHVDIQVEEKSSTFLSSQVLSSSSSR